MKVLFCARRFFRSAETGTEFLSLPLIPHSRSTHVASLLFFLPLRELFLFVCSCLLPRPGSTVPSARRDQRRLCSLPNPMSTAVRILPALANVPDDAFDDWTAGRRQTNSVFRLTELAADVQPSALRKLRAAVVEDTPMGNPDFKVAADYVTSASWTRPTTAAAAWSPRRWACVGHCGLS